MIPKGIIACARKIYNRLEASLTCEQMVQLFKPDGMSMVHRDSSDNQESIAEDIRKFVSGLSQEERMLVILKSQLYDHHWEPMLDDLKNRLTGKPYIFKLANRIHDDIERIEKLRTFEQQHKVDLSDHVEIS